MKMIVLRGLPGAGKSTRAKEIVKETMFENKTSAVCSADNFFIDRNSCEYKFDGRKLTEAHSWCKGGADMAMKLATDVVVIDNVSSQKWEYEPYIEIANHYGYEVVEETVGGRSEQEIKEYHNRNKHGVPLEAIRKMANRWQE